MAAKFQFCFTLDTEPDDLWSNPPELSFEHFQRLPEFHRRLRGAGARPVYLTTSEVAQSPQARRALQSCIDYGGCEIGAHFHTWTREWPFTLPDLGSPRRSAMAHQLGQQVEEAMLAYTCRELNQAFGMHPSSYRGGRWSLSPASVTSLENCGIRVDSTVTPGISWRDNSHPLVDGPDYRRAPRDPVSVSEALGGPPDEDGPLEIPVGAAWFPSWAQNSSNFVRKQLSRAGARTGLRLGHRWLRPTSVSLADMIATMKSLRAASVPVWVFMIHSSEISPCRPLPSETAVQAFVNRCEQAIAAAIDLGAQPATLTEAAQCLRPGVSPLAVGKD